AAKGEIVFTLDNDVLFTTPDDVARGVAAFERHSRAAVVSFTILGPGGTLSRRDWCHPRDPDRWADTEFLTDYVLEGASACRRAPASSEPARGGSWTRRAERVRRCRRGGRCRARRRGGSLGSARSSRRWPRGRFATRASG